MSDKYPGGFVTAGAPAGFSVAFDGSGDYLTVPASSNFAPGTGDFTVDGWIYPTSSAIQRFFAQTTGGTNYFCCEADVPNKTIRFIGTSSGGGTPILSAATLQINQWNYFCISRTSGTVTVWCNGSAGTPTSNTTDFNNTSYVPTISGYTHSTSSEPIIGYLAGLRYIKGTALSGAVAPTVAFPVTNTQLLTCQSPTIIDLSTNALTVTVNGDAKVSNFTPFAGYTGFNPALGAAAGGVWTLDEAAYYQQNRIWPIYDPYFNQTTLMLHGNGTNGAQNNTFLDSSTNNFTITRNGNTTQGTFTPFSQTGWSYNGTAGAYCQLNNADYSLGTGDFTVETWMYCVDDSTYSYANICSAPSNPNFTVGFGAGGGSGARQFYVEYGGSATSFGSNMSGYLNRWTHIAVVRQSGTVTAYQNGVSLGSVSKSASVGSTANLYLLRNSGDANMDFRGYISNYRITKAAVYSSNFTPSAQPLTVLPNTVMLTFQDNRFVDNSALRATVTPAGTASVQAFSPFVPAYITPTTYSNFFDGTGDYLTAASSSNLTLGTGDFTIEAWIYPVNWTNSSASVVRGNGATNSPAFAKYDANPNFGLANEGVAWIINDAALPTVNTWSHVAVTRSGTTVKIFINGVQSGSTATSSVDFTNPIRTIGTNSGTDAFFAGCISNVRVLKGTALYTTAFTPPTAPFTAITNTQLLTCQNSTFIDNSANTLAITASGNVQPVTSPTPFPAKADTTTLNSAYSTSLIGGSTYNGGAGDGLSFLTSSTQFGVTGDFTAEVWIYPVATSSSYNTVFTLYTLTSSDTGSYGLYYNTSYNLFWLNSGAGGNGFDSGAGINIVPYQWNHVAISRSGANIRCWTNGVLRISNWGIGAIDGAQRFLYVGTNRQYTDTVPGYMAGFRFVNGTAVYPTAANFSPPLLPPTNISNTAALVNSTNGAIFDNTAKNVFQTVGAVQLSTTQSKWGGSSIYFANGGTDYLINPYVNNPNFSFGGDFTVELWVYPTSTPDTYNCIIGNFSESGATYGWNLMLTSGQLVHVNVAGTSNNSAQTVPLNTWTHLAITRAGSTVYIFVNGRRDTTTLNTSALAYNPVYPLRIGRQVDTTPRYFFGYMDDIRITKGYARYTTNFTPPTSQLQDQ
jgi:hypothetical protein